MFHRVRKGLNCPIRLEHKFEMIFQLLAGIKNKNIMIDICVSYVDNLTIDFCLYFCIYF